MEKGQMPCTGETTNMALILCILTCNDCLLQCVICHMIFFFGGLFVIWFITWIAIVGRIITYKEVCCVSLYEYFVVHRVIIDSSCS